MASEVVGTIPKAGEAGEQKSPQAKETRPTKVLPTDRVGFSKQLQLLKAYAALYAQLNRAVTNPEAAELVKIHQNTSILAHPFYVDANLLQKAGNGYIPSAEVVSYVRALSWNPDTAGLKLAPAFRSTWFGQVVLPRIAMGPREEQEVVEALADASASNPKYEGQLSTILDYLKLAGLIIKEGSLIRQGPVTADGEATMRNDATAQRAPEPTPTPAPREVSRTGSVATAFAQAPEGRLNIVVELSFDMSELAGWKPEVVTALFGGVAQILSAKAMVERGAAK